MNLITHGVELGFGILLLNFLAWRFLWFSDERIRLVIRTLLFLSLCYVLWVVQLSPFRVAPWEDEPPRHLLAQILEFLWWLQAAQISSALLSKVLLPPELQREHLFRDVLRALVFAAASVAAVAYVLKLPLGGLLATSGALAIVLGLAVQSTLADVFSGVVLNATQPFHVGDMVTIGDIQGSVIERTWRATTLLNSQGNYVVVPNSTAAKASIVNQSRPPAMHGLTVVVRVSPAVRPATVFAALSDALEATVGVLESPKPVVSARLIHRKFVEYEILAYVASASDRTQTQNEIVDQAHRNLRAHGVELVPTTQDSSPEKVGERLLRGVEMFHSLNAAQLSQLASELESEVFSAGELIYQITPECPDERRALYILASGVASLLTPHDGQEIEVRRLAPGDAVGRAGILTGISTGIKLRALSRVRVVKLRKDALSPILQQYPEIAKHMLEALLAFQAREAAILSEIPTQVSNKGGLFSRLFDGMRRLHQMVH